MTAPAPRDRATQRPAANSDARKRAEEREIRGRVERLIPAHITIAEPQGKADCSICGIGISAPPSFGGVPRTDMLVSFIVQHAAHTKAGVASGLTATGKPSKAAQTVLGALQ